MNLIQIKNFILEWTLIKMLMNTRQFRYKLQTDCQFFNSKENQFLNIRKSTKNCYQILSFSEERMELSSINLAVHTVINLSFQTNFLSHCAEFIALGGRNDRPEPECTLLMFIGTKL